MRILVAGGAGYIGSVTVDLLQRSGHEVHVIDNLSYGHQAALSSETAFDVADLSNGDAIKAIAEAFQPEAAVHFAAFIAVGESVVKPDIYYRNNVTNAQNLLEALRLTGGKYFVFSSTAAVYGEPTAIPITEDHPIAPENPYGHSKRMFEIILESYDTAYGIKHVIPRYFNAAGATETLGEDHHPETHLIPLVIQAAMGQRENIKVFGADYDTPDGTCIRDYIHVEDLAQAHLSALNYLADGGASVKLNLGNGAGYSVREVIASVERVSGRPVPVVEAERRAGDASRLIAASDRARTILNWTPKHPDLDDIVRSAWDWRQKHPDGYEG